MTDATIQSYLQLSEEFGSRRKNFFKPSACSSSSSIAPPEACFREIFYFLLWPYFFQNSENIASGTWPQTPGLQNSFMNLNYHRIQNPETRCLHADLLAEQQPFGPKHPLSLVELHREISKLMKITKESIQKTYGT